MTDFRFHSTRDLDHQVSFSEAIKMGLARDGGLFVPTQWPEVRTDSQQTFSKVAQDLLGSFGAQPEVVSQALNFPVPLQSWSPYLYQLELFHGPTAAFKDFGARFLAGTLNALAAQKESSDKTSDAATGETTHIVVATSGDTGGAVASAFSEFPQFRVNILFPDQGVSPVQRTQLTCWGNNVRSFAVNGTFDQCQKIVKQVIPELQAQQIPITSANSINIGRILPQMTYYYWSALQLFERTGSRVRFVVPSGNVGNVMASIWAKKLGAPIEEIGVATNANNVISHYWSTGQWQPQSSVSTLANAMDVGNPSNMERFFDMFGKEKPDWIQVQSVADNQILEALIEVHKKYDQVICPHTATAYHMFQHHYSGSHVQNLPTVLVGTAHPAKFPEVIQKALGLNPEVPENLERLMELQTHEVPVEPNAEIISSLISENN